MKTKWTFTLVLLIGLAVANGGSVRPGLAEEPEPNGAVGIQALLGTAFTYQGQLKLNGTLVNSACDLTFRLFDAESGGSQIDGTSIATDVPVTNGLFTVTLNFGNVFNGTALWLDIAVRCPAGTGEFTPLSPRQALTGVPYAQYATNNWSLTGNAGTNPATNFLGTTDNRQLVLKANNTEGLRITTDGNVGVGTALPGARLEARETSGGIALMGTSTSRAVIGRLGSISCPGTYAVGGCAGDTGGFGVLGTSDTGVGVRGTSNTNRAVEGFSVSGIGVIGDSSTRGVVGTLGRTSCAGTYAVGGCAGLLGDGVLGRSNTGAGVRAITASGDIFIGESPSGVRRARIDTAGKGFFNGGTQTGGADFAESMPTTDNSAELEPGDVLAIDPQAGYAVRQSREPNSRLVAGVYSTQPSVLAVGQRGIDDSLAGEVPVALLGVVPTKVTAENGPIQIGDLLVTSSLPGHAMKAQPRVIDGVEVYQTGTILGKALEPLPQGTGVIKVLVTLR